MMDQMVRARVERMVNPRHTSSVISNWVKSGLTGDSSSVAVIWYDDNNGNAK